MKDFICILLASTLAVLSACAKTSSDQTGPVISNIQISGNVLVISDCPSTSVELLATVSDPSGVEKVLFWYRIAPDQEFAAAPMALRDGLYVASLNGANFLGHAYGTIDFYISAQDTVGNTSRSEVDQSVQFLPCVNN